MVLVFSNCDEVELFVNGESVGLQQLDEGPDTEYGEVITGYEVDYWLTDDDRKDFALPPTRRQVSWHSRSRCSVRCRAHAFCPRISFLRYQQAP